MPYTNCPDCGKHLSESEYKAQFCNYCAENMTDEQLKEKFIKIIHAIQALKRVDTQIVKEPERLKKLNKDSDRLISNYTKLIKRLEE